MGIEVGSKRLVRDYGEPLDGAQCVRLPRHRPVLSHREALESRSRKASWRIEKMLSIYRDAAATRCAEALRLLLATLRWRR